jgi:hypothetical protein
MKATPDGRSSCSEGRKAGPFRLLVEVELEEAWPIIVGLVRRECKRSVMPSTNTKI